jgi:hypothetical protein
MVGTMGFIALALATTGLYGLIAYTVSRRVKEFGIRVAVGASRRDVVWLVERRGLILAGVGIAIGGALAVAAAPILAAGSPGLGVSSPGVYVVVPLALLVVCAVASYVPARRAAGLARMSHRFWQPSWQGAENRRDGRLECWIRKNSQFLRPHVTSSSGMECPPERIDFPRRRL